MTFDRFKTSGRLSDPTSDTPNCKDLWHVSTGTFILIHVIRHSLWQFLAHSPMFSLLSLIHLHHRIIMFAPREIFEDNIFMSVDMNCSKHCIHTSDSHTASGEKHFLELRQISCSCHNFNIVREFHAGTDSMNVLKISSAGILQYCSHNKSVLCLFVENVFC